MKRLVCLLSVLLLCVSLGVSAFAEEDNFVPSITYKPNPELVSGVADDGTEYVGIIRDSSGKVLSYVTAGCLRITPIAHVWDEEIKVPEEIENLLLFVYEGLNDASLAIPYEKHEADLDPANMVVRDLFDVRWTCKEHPEMLAPEGVTIDLIFDLGVVADAEIFVQTFDENDKSWSPIVKTVNNGDGTVTCTFEHFCVVAFSMPIVTGSAPAAEEAEKAPVWPWLALLGAAAAGTGVTVYARKKKKTTV